jgi:GT2 family glycosyltransferase
LKGLAGYPLRGFYAHPTGFPDPKDFVRNCSPVGGACMMVRKNVFEQVRGFDEQSPDACNDIHFCLRVRQAGYRIVWTPDAELYHEGGSAPISDEYQRRYLRSPYLRVRNRHAYARPADRRARQIPFAISRSKRSYFALLLGDISPRESPPLNRIVG